MSNILFSIVQGANAIVFENGVYKQVDVYESEGFLFAKAKGGYVRLLNDKKTSIPKMTWKGIVGCNFEVYINHGWLKLTGVKND